MTVTGTMSNCSASDYKTPLLPGRELTGEDGGGWAAILHANGFGCRKLDDKSSVQEEEGHLSGNLV